VISSEAFRDQPELKADGVLLKPLTVEYLDEYFAMLREPVGMRFTGTQATFTLAGARRWLETRQDHDDRADWAILRAEDGAFAGEVVLNELDPRNASASFRIALAGPQVYGQGLGTVATRLVVGYALEVVGLHRIGLEVYDFNPRARHVYEKCGFVAEGRSRDALRWDGEWHDAIVMSILATDPRP
jgi:RimJ/RimL family protein N-acetyltransferase